MATDQLLQINYLLISRNNPLCFSSTDSGDSGRYPHCHGRLLALSTACCSSGAGFLPRSTEIGRLASAAWLGTGGSLRAFPHPRRGIVRPQQIHTETLLTGTSSCSCSCSCQMAPTYLVQVAHLTKPVLLWEPGRGHVAPLLCGTSGDGV